jgi:hypothetical protein
MNKIKVVSVRNYYILCHEDVGGSECIDPRILYLDTRWR